MYDAKVVAKYGDAHGLTVFTNAFLIDCTGADPIEGAAVVVEDDRIKEVAPNGQVGALPGRGDHARPQGRRRSCPASPTPTCTSAR